MYSREELESMNTNSVRGIASKSGIKNASSHKKDELIDLILHEESESDTSFDIDEETGEVMEFDAEPSICPIPVPTYDQESSIEEFEIPLDEDFAEEKPVSRSMQKKQKKHERLNKQNRQQEQAEEISFEHLNKKINAEEPGKVQSENAEGSNDAKQEDAKPKAAEQQALDLDGENEKTQEQAAEAQPSAEELEKARRSAMAKHRGSAAEAPKAKEEKVEEAEAVEINKRDALLIAVAAVAILHSVFAICDAIYEILWLGSTTIYWWYTVLMIGVLVGGVYMMKRANNSGQLIAVLNLIHNKTINILSEKKKKGENK